MQSRNNLSPRDIPRNARSTRQLATFADRHGALLRERVQLSAATPLNPRALADSFGVVFMYPQDVDGMTMEDLLFVTGLDAKTWSGMSLALPGSGALVMLNPQQTQQRANVTIVEEVAHLYFGHQPSQLVTLPIGSWKRKYDPAAEGEAYWTAAAALLPAQVVGRAVWSGRTAEDVGLEFGVSRELVEFRIKTLSLWLDYRARQQKQNGEKVNG